MKTPPTKWTDLWKPEYKGRVGIVGPHTTAGAVLLVEIAKAFGGSETDVEPAFKALKELLPNLGGIAPSPGALMTLLAQGRSTSCPTTPTTRVPEGARQRHRAGDPEGGMALQTITLAIIKNAKNRDLVKPMIETILSADIQTRLEAEPVRQRADQRRSG